MLVNVRKPFGQPSIGTVAKFRLTASISGTKAGKSEKLGCNCVLVRALLRTWLSLTRKVPYTQLLPLCFVANVPVRRQDFVPILIALFHSIYFPLMLRAIWVAGLVAKTLRRGARREI
jgi:hypothetical protein